MNLCGLKDEAHKYRRAFFILHTFAFILWDGDVAQLGERRLCKADVRGSSPLIST
jgi:hypothetical protein